MEAYRQLQSDLMRNMGSLVPAVVSLKDLLTTSIGIEEFLKGASDTGKNPLEVFQEFLNGTDLEKEPALLETEIGSGTVQ